MKFFKSWVQEYIVEQLPEDKVIVEALNKKAFEVEEVIDTPSGTVFDVKILPNRAHDSLGHHGFAYELCATLGLTFNTATHIEEKDFINKHIETPTLTIEDPQHCFRFASLRIDSISVEESPEWLKKRLEAIGQRSINNIVDITNYVQFALNKPMHAYDASVIKGGLIARMAQEGESLVTLDDKSLTLDKETLVIADNEKVLGLAGIKGGKFSGITKETTSIILESANFAPTLIRKTAQKYDIRTDASKRFENGIANNLVIEGLHMTANLIKETCLQAERSEVADVYPKKDTSYYVGISLQECNEILGTTYSSTDIETTLKRLSFPFEKIIPKKYIKEIYPTLLGAGYKNPSSMREDAPRLFSCSSLISYLYKGVWMPSLSVDKYVFATKISKDDLQFGDLIFANTGEGVIRYESVEFLKGTKVPEGIDHVGMYTGENKILHATKVKGMVVEETLEEFSQGRNIIGYGRIVDDLEEERFVVRVPSVRLDIRIKEDLAEEIGRIIGYDKLTPVLPPIARTGVLHKRMIYENKVRELLYGNGYGEVMTYTFGDKGEVLLKKGLADDKEKLRDDLATGMLKAMNLNIYNAPLLGEKEIKIFEFGNIFKDNDEKRYLCLGHDDGAKKSNFSDQVDIVLSAIKRELGVATLEFQVTSNKPYIVEIDFDDLIKKLPEKVEYETPSFAMLPTSLYSSLSLYPFITRDIALWVPEDVQWENILELTKTIKNPLVVRTDLFDTFSKEIEGVKKNSYAFRLVFQSFEKTLTDDEVNEMMKEYYSLFESKQYSIR